MRYLVNFIETEESRIVVARFYRDGGGELVSMVIEFQYCKMERVLWMDGGDGCKT